MKLSDFFIALLIVLFAWAITAFFSQGHALTSREIEAKIAHAKALRAKLLPHENAKPKVSPQEITSMDEVDPASIKKVKTISYHVPAIPKPEVQVVENEDFNELDAQAPEILEAPSKMVTLAQVTPPGPTEMTKEPLFQLTPIYPGWLDLSLSVAIGGALGMLGTLLVPWGRRVLYAAFEPRLRPYPPRTGPGLRLWGRVCGFLYHLWPRLLLSRAAVDFGRQPIRPLGDDRREPRFETRNSRPSYGYDKWPFGTGNNKRLGTASPAPWTHHRPFIRRSAGA